MQAVILAGGQGTRLRPLTLTVPKPVMPLAGRPFLTFMIDWLAGHGVDDVLLSCGFLAERVEQVLGHEYGGVRLRYVREEEPLGTAGPVRLAADLGLLDERFLVLNGDVLCDLDLTALLARHTGTGALVTLSLVSVEDVSSYGLVPTAADGHVLAFLEKGGEGPIPTDRINAGAYVVERAVVEGIPSGRAVSFEREVFPGLVDHGLYGHHAEGYWIDIGTVARYLEATQDLLSGRAPSTLPARDSSGSLVYGGVAAEGAHVGPLSVLGEGSSVGAGSRVERAVLHERVRVGAGCTIIGAVAASDVVVEDGARVGEGAVLGGGAAVAHGAEVEPDARIAPGERVG